MAKKGIFSWHLVFWPIVTWLFISGICYLLDKHGDPAVERLRVPGTNNWYSEIIPGNPLEWAPLVWGFTAAGILAVMLYMFCCWTIYHHAKLHNRNAVRWTTASIVFTPVLAWIAYGLSWRKSL